MSKKIMVFAVAVLSAALFALPSMAAAQEIHLEPAESYTVSGLGVEWRSEGEPSITCTKTEGSGNFDTGSTTTGTFFMFLSGCHTQVFGFTASCKSEGNVTSGTISTGGFFHLITVSSGVPGVLLTTFPTKIVCAGISVITVSGNVIGTITSPKCGESSKARSLSFTATGTVQNHLSYTGTKYDLTAQTGSGELRTSALVSTGSVTNTQSSAGKLNCT
jgi:hypothetical protein